jgi:hypothetical protein
VFPIYWMAITAFKQDPDLYRMDQFPLWFHLPAMRWPGSGSPGPRTSGSPSS